VFVFDRLLHTTDSKTGKPFTITNAAEAVGHPEGWGSRRVREQNIFRTEYPQAKEGPLAENEKAFFMGLAANKTFHIEPVTIRNREYVIVGSGAMRNTRRRAVIQKILSRWGQIRESQDETRVCLYAPTFDFMKAPAVDRNFLRAKARFAPFLRGFMLTRTTQDGRIFSTDPELLINFNRWFKGFFGFPMDDFLEKGRKDTSYLQLTHPEKVMAALDQEKSIQNLPFFEDLKDIREPQKK